jgi:hypothetical protein
MNISSIANSGMLQAVAALQQAMETPEKLLELQQQDVVKSAAPPTPDDEHLPEGVGRNVNEVA